MDYLHVPLAPNQSLLTYDTTCQLSYPARYAHDNRPIAYPHKIPSKMSNFAQRLFEQITSRVNDVVHVVAERQVRLDVTMKGIVEQQQISSVTVQSMVTQQENTNNYLRTVVQQQVKANVAVQNVVAKQAVMAEQQMKADLAVQSVVAKQGVMAEQQTRTDDLLQTILAHQTETMSTISKIHTLGISGSESRTKGVSDSRPGSDLAKSMNKPAPSVPCGQIKPVTTSANRNVKRNIALIDEWIDGPFHDTFLNDQLDAASDESGRKRQDLFFCHWEMVDPGRKTKGDVEAETDNLGRCTRRFCLGLIGCATGQCEWVDKPQTKKGPRKSQLTHTCNCGTPVTHFTCDIVQEFHHYKHGISVKCSGYHHHARPPKLHLSKTESRALTRSKKLNPKAMPSTFIMGVIGPDGKQTNVQDISDILINRDRVSYEVKKEKKKKLTDEGLFG